ncbi:MAG: rRNA maturation RNase YbeY, partial [Bacteroidales bacterium]|nr:rRNA maturation RNase YbeY [Bacteroidales bacterium]
MILFYSETNFILHQKLIYKKWLQALAQNEQKKLGNINYIFCDDDYLLNLNLQYLQHDTLTDIITFDYCEEDTISGDIYISIERVRENAVIFKVYFDA